MFSKRYAAFLHCGFNAAAAEERCLGQVRLMDRLLACLRTAGPRLAVERLKQAHAAGQRQAAYAEAHQLKGLAGSLAMENLYGQAGELCRLLRAQQASTPAEETLLRQLAASWQQLLAALQAYETQYPPTDC